MVFRVLSVLTLLLFIAFSLSCFAQVAPEHETKLILPKEKIKVTGERPDVAQVAKLLVKQTNDFRESEKCPKLVVEAKLQETAQYFADYMGKTNKYGHSADDSEPHERAKKHGYDYCLVAENIAYQFSSTGFKAEELSKQLTEAWKKSPGHRKNMIDPDVTETGMAVARSEETGYYFAVQMFGLPKSAAISFEVANETDAELEYKLGKEKFPLPPGLIRTHQICRPEQFTIRWPKTDTDVPSVRPGKGERITIVKENGEFTLKKK